VGGLEVSWLSIASHYQQVVVVFVGYGWVSRGAGEGASEAEKYSTTHPSRAHIEKIEQKDNAICYGKCFDAMRRGQRKTGTTSTPLTFPLLLTGTTSQPINIQRLQIREEISRSEEVADREIRKSGLCRPFGIQHRQHLIGLYEVVFILWKR
jgi:hypothetical protein